MRVTMPFYDVVEVAPDGRQLAAPDDDRPGLHAAVVAGRMAARHRHDDRVAGVLHDLRQRPEAGLAGLASIVLPLVQLLDDLGLVDAVDRPARSPDRGPPMVNRLLVRHVDTKQVVGVDVDLPGSELVTVDGKALKAIGTDQQVLQRPFGASQYAVDGGLRLERIAHPTDELLHCRRGRCDDFRFDGGLWGWLNDGGQDS